jgi:hypothetical protein
MCDCRTRDGGRACRADGECEGACVFERFEDVPSAEFTCAPGETAKRAIGKCSRHMLRFGCHAYMDSARAQCVPPGAEPRMQYLCVD